MSFFLHASTITLLLRNETHDLLVKVHVPVNFSQGSSMSITVMR